MQRQGVVPGAAPCRAWVTSLPQDSGAQAVAFTCSVLRLVPAIPKAQMGKHGDSSLRTPGGQGVRRSWRWSQDPLITRWSPLEAQRCSPPSSLYPSSSTLQNHLPGILQELQTGTSKGEPDRTR